MTPPKGLTGPTLPADVLEKLSALTKAVKTHGADLNMAVVFQVPGAAPDLGIPAIIVGNQAALRNQLYGAVLGLSMQLDTAPQLTPCDCPDCRGRRGETSLAGKEAPRVTH